MKRKHHKETRAERRLRRIAVLPSLVTLINAIFGFAAIHFTARGMNEPNRLWWEKPELTFFAAAAWMIFLAMIADALDGRLARMSRSTSSFGGQLDSLADMISFGVAPAFLMLRVMESSGAGPASPAFGSILGRLLWLLAATYICCTALRLARFNVENQPEESAHMHFSGLPSPAAAGLVAALVLLYGDILPQLQQGPVPMLAKLGSQVIIYVLPFATLGGALLMVSRIPYPHIVNYYIRGRRSFRHVVRVVLLVLLLIWQPQLTLAAGFIIFVSGAVIRQLWHRYLKHAKATNTQAANISASAGDGNAVLRNADSNA